MEDDIPEVSCPLEIVETLEVEEESNIEVLEAVKYDVDLINQEY